MALSVSDVAIPSLIILSIFISGCESTDDGPYPCTGPACDNSSTQTPSNSETESPSTGGNLFGIGNSSNTVGAADIRRQLSATPISRDNTQAKPTSFELNQLNQIDQFRTSSVPLETHVYDSIINILRNRVGIPNSLIVIIEQDMRFNRNLGGISGGHAGNSYISLDGRLISFLAEVSVYYGSYYTGDTSEPEESAIDRIATSHAANFNEYYYYYYDYSLLEPQAKEISDDIFASLVAMILYHEFGHYFLFHALDFVRSNLDWTGLVVFSSTNEDDADFISGYLSAKAQLNREFGIFAYDLFILFSTLSQGGFATLRSVQGSPAAQWITNSIQYSPLAIRKQNFARGFDSHTAIGGR